jgi:t-SNARE complex subunit (syntaxin)
MYCKKQQVTSNNLGLESSRLNNATDKIETTRQRFQEIEVLLDDLRSGKVIYERSVQQNEEREIIQRVERTYQLLKNDLQKIKSELDELKAELDSGNDIFDNKEKEFIQTSIDSFYQSLKEKLTEAQRHYSDFKEFSKKKVSRQIKNIDTEGKFSEDEINRMVEDDPAALNKVIQQQVLGKASMRLQTAAQDISEKCEGIKRLQKNVKELLEMLKEISQIVMMQGEKVNTIAEHVEKAKNHVAQANVNLKQAKEHHQSARCV